MAFKMRGWSSHTRHHDIPKFPEKPKEYTEEQKKKFAEKEKESIQKKIKKKEEKIKKKIAKGSTWGLGRKQRKVEKLKKAYASADGSATIKMIEQRDEIKEDQKRMREDRNRLRSGFTKKKNKKA